MRRTSQTRKSPGKKIVLQERLDKSVPPRGLLEDCIELALHFLSRHWNIYKNGNFAIRQTVLMLASAGPLRYSQNGVWNSRILILFQVFRGIFGGK